nr:PPE family protein [Mycobacterium simiae]
MAAAAAWDGLAAELSSAAASYRGTVTELADMSWLGPSSTSMNAAAETYVAWLNTTASEARQTANQARSSAAAFEAAYTATVPPPVIATNRTVLAALVATNILGQNTPAIAATEAQYSAMWAQDAVAMYTYAAASATATALTPFTSAPQNTNPAGQAAQQASTDQATANTAHTLLSNIPHVLQTMAQGGTPAATATATDPISTFQSFFNDISGFISGEFGNSFVASGTLYTIFPMVDTALGPLVSSLSATKVSDVSGAPAAGLGNLVGSSSPAAGAGQGAITAGLGDSGLVGKLSVPPSWSTATPQIRLASTALPIAGLDATPAATATPPTLFGGIPPMASVVNAPRGNSTYSQGLRSNLLGQDAGRPGYRERTRDHQSQPQHNSLDAEIAALTDEDILRQLHQELTDLSNERDMLKQTAAFLIEEAQK